MQKGGCHERGSVDSDVACLRCSELGRRPSGRRPADNRHAGSAERHLDDRRAANPPASRSLRRHDQSRCSQLHALLAATSAAAEGRAEHPADHHRRRGLRRAEHIRRRHSDADARSHRQYGPALHAISHHFAMLAHACGPHYRAQSSLGRLWRDQRGVDRLSRVQQRHHQGKGNHWADSEGEWLCDVLVRQEPQHAVIRDQPGRPLRPMARGHGL